MLVFIIYIFQCGESPGLVAEEAFFPAPHTVVATVSHWDHTQSSDSLGPAKASY